MIGRAGPPSVHALGLAAVAGALLAAALLLPLDSPLLLLFSCPFRAATHLPCLACGCTRAFHWAVRGEILRALSFSPLGVTLAFGCALHLCWTALRLCGLPFAPRLEMTPGLRRAALLALLANWAFVALRGAA